MNENKNKSDNVQELLAQVHQMMTHYLDALESDLHHSADTQQNDARLFNTLAQTLTRLAAFEQLVQPKEGQINNGDTQSNLEQRLLQLVRSKPDKKFSP